MLLQLSDSFPINKKKTTQTFIHHFFFQNNNICREWLKHGLTHKCNTVVEGIKEQDSTIETIQLVDQVFRIS